MSIFSRFSDIVDANVNDLLDRAEDPEKMVKLLIVEMEEHVEKAREGLVKTIAGEKNLEANLKRNREAAAEWEARGGICFGARRREVGPQVPGPQEGA